jgi:hypothetical protein
MTWTLAASAATVPAAEREFALVLDGAGSHVPLGAPVWYGVSTDGALLLGATTTDGDGPLARRGVVLGVR